MPNRIVTVENCKIGDKVVRGRDWYWDNQDKDSIYGVIVKIENTRWVTVNWINHKGLVTLEASYRAGNLKHDLYFYEQ